MGNRQARPELLALTGQAGTIEASASPISRERGVVEGVDSTGIADHGHSPSLTASVKLSSTQLHLAGRRALSDGAGCPFDARLHRQPAGACPCCVRLQKSPGLEL